MRAGEGRREGEGEGGERWHSEAEESTRVRTVADAASWRTRGPGALSAVHVQRADSNHGGRVFFKKLEFR